MQRASLCMILALAIGFSGAVTEDDYDVWRDETMEAPRPLRDRFRIIQTNLTASKLQIEIDDFTSYSCERMVVLTNEANAYFSVWCNTKDDKVREVHVYPGESFSFTFKPRSNGKSVYQCTLDYMRKWAIFDVYNNEEWYTCSRDNNLVDRYYVKHDGIYADKHKIRALFKGHDEYTLWENYDDTTSETDGLLMNGFVDGGMCANIPKEMNDRASAVTVCDHQCVILYEHYRCWGKSRKFQAGDGCIDFKLEELNKITSAVKGC